MDEEERNTSVRLVFMMTRFSIRIGGPEDYSVIRRLDEINRIFQYKMSLKMRLKKKMDAAGE